MKRLLCIVAALCLLLCACGAPVETSAPSETTLPPVTEPVIETTAPVETAPPETPTPAAQEYTHRIEDPETMLYAGPAFVSGAVAMVEEAGTYTIVEEVLDSDGNTWGRLKSGAGWICLTEPALSPIYADYAEESFNAYHAYWSDETDYITAIGFTPAEKLTDVRFGLLDWFETESWQMSEELYTMDEIDPDHAFLAQVVFWGDMTTYGISFTDTDGEPRHFAVSISGKDGSLVCTEYMP
ncbi:MAG: hypothetical protein IKU31_01440 [Oscillospiraceae bacterium]|nr:hypothetical protein [Oscillospiraceae bacterium]